MNNNLNKIYIEPSGDFSKNTMLKLQKANEHKQFMKRMVVWSAAIAPSITREAWLFVRGDYVAVSSLPMGDMIAGAYRMFLMPTTGYFLVVTAVSLPVGYLAFKFGHKLSFSKA